MAEYKYALVNRDRMHGYCGRYIGAPADTRGTDRPLAEGGE